MTHDPNLPFLTAHDGTVFQTLRPAETITRPVQRQVLIGVVVTERDEPRIRYEEGALDPESGVPILTPVTTIEKVPVREEVWDTTTEEETVTLPREWDEAATHAALAAYVAANPPPAPEPEPQPETPVEA